MKLSIQNQKKAMEMRLSGASYSEIMKEVTVSRGTLSSWLKHVKLTDAQKAELKQRYSPKMSKGRMNALIARRSARLFREKTVFDEAQREFLTLAEDPFFFVGLALYWAHGTQQGSTFQFAVSDRSMLGVMVSWIKKYLTEDENLIKMRDYKGYLRIDISRIDVLRRVIAWQKLFIQYYDKV